MSWFTDFRKVITQPAVLAAPLTGGASLALAKDNNGYSILDYLRGVPDIDKQNKFNAEQAQLDRDFQMWMSNTAYQRGYTDLLMTGLNPNLAGGSGGASTPGGAMASSAGLPESPGALMSNVATAGAEMATGLKTLEESKYVKDTAKAKIGKTIAETAEAQARTTLTEAQQQNVKQQFQMLTLAEQQQALELAAAYQEAPNRAKQAEIEKKFYNTWWGRNMKYTGMTLSSILPILAPIGRYAGGSKGGITINTAQVGN